MNTQSILHSAILVLLAGILFTLVDPFMYWMPSMTQVICMTGAAALIVVLAGFVIRESAVDERDAVHRMLAGRIAFLAGVTTLTFALVLQGITHQIDPWIPGTLFAMVVAKAGTRWYADRFL